MNDDVGYRKPPKHSRFRIGISGNPKGRPKRKQPDTSTIFADVMNGRADYRENGVVKSMSRMEFSVKTLVDRAVRGEVKAAVSLLDLYVHAERHDGQHVERILVDGWLPDYAGQNAEQKTADTAMRSEAKPVGWWEDPGKRLEEPDA